MDPEANLKKQLELSRDIPKAWDNCNDDGTLSAASLEQVADDANRLSELVESLDGWIRMGGFLPKRWHWARKDLV
jgi:hypothetical protein